MIRLLLAVLLLAVPAIAQDTYYTSTTGNDSTGDGSIGTPWLLDGDWTAEMAGVTAANGDTLYLCVASCSDASGSATVTGPNSDNFVSGTSFANALTVCPLTGESITFNGTTSFQDSENYLIIGCDDQEVLTFTPGAGSHGVRFANGTRNIRLTNFNVNTVEDASGVLWTSSADANATHADCGFEVLNGTIHTVQDSQTTTNQYHGMYLSCGPFLVRNVEIYDIFDGYGIQVYNGNDSNITGGVIDGLRVHDINAPGFSGAGILLSTGSAGGSGTRLSNSWIWDTNGDDSIQAGIGSGSTHCATCIIANNTVDDEIQISDSTPDTSASVECNIRAVYNDAETGNTEQDGITFASVTLVNKTEGSEDFHLDAGDTNAIDQCDPIPTEFTNDYDNVARGAAPWDIGSDQTAAAPGSSGTSIFLPPGMR